MSDHIQLTIRTLEQEIEAIEQRRGDLLRAIEALQPLAGVPTAPARPQASNGARALRGTNGTGPYDDRIVALLREQGAMKPKAFAKAMKVAPIVLRKHLKRLAAAGVVELTGSTMNRQISLPRKAAAKEGI